MKSKILKILEELDILVICPEHAEIGGVAEVSFDTMASLEKFTSLIVEDCARFLMDVLDDSFAAEQLIEYFDEDE